MTHTREVLEALGGIVQSLTDAESGQRGYLLSGQADYLPHVNNLEEAAKQYAEKVRGSDQRQSQSAAPARICCSP